MSQEKYNELAFYTLSLHDETFIHQHLVDAYAVQYATTETKAITITFALVGLYLFIMEDYTGKDIQQFHTLMSNNKIVWPIFILPHSPGEITIDDVIKCTEGAIRNSMIKTWCQSVWEANCENHSEVKALAKYFMEINRV